MISYKIIKMETINYGRCVTLGIAGDVHCVSTFMSREYKAYNATIRTESRDLGYPGTR